MLVRSRVRGVCSELACHQHCGAKCCYSTALDARKDTYSFAKAKQDGAVLLESDAAKWLSEDVRRVVLALDVLGLDGA
eukprot:6172988-Pleurochrysis_carterae.AAC.1